MKDVAWAIGVLSRWRKQSLSTRSWSVCLGGVCDLSDGYVLNRFPAETDELAIVAAATSVADIDPSTELAASVANGFHHSLERLRKEWGNAAAFHRKAAYDADSGLREQSRAIFAGRSDGYQNAADTLGFVLRMFEIGMDVAEIHIGSEPVSEER